MSDDFIYSAERKIILLYENAMIFLKGTHYAYAPKNIQPQ